jgi:hypothetical protein
MTFISRLKCIGFASEGTPGTAETLGGEDYDFRVVQDSITYSPEIEEFKRAYATKDFAAYSSIMGKRKGTVGFTVDMAWSGTAATPPEYGKLLKSCCIKETPTTTVVYDNDKLYNNVSGTLEVQEANEGASAAGLVIKLKGCMGNAEFVMGSVGQPIQIKFAFTGVLSSVADRTYANLFTPSGFDNTVADAVLASTITFQTKTVTINTLSLNLGNDIQLRTDPADSAGYLMAYVVDTVPTLKIDPLLDTIANQPFFAAWTGGTTGAFSMTIGSHLTLAAPCAQIVKGYDGANRDKFVVNTLDCILTRTNDTDDRFFSLTQA